MKNRVFGWIVFAALIVGIPMIGVLHPVGNSENPPALDVVLGGAQNDETESKVGASLQTDAKKEDPIQSEVDPQEMEIVDKPAANIPTKTLAAPAQFQIQNTASGKIMQVEVRDFVRGALAAEMPPTFHPEALKAQAVAAHSYAVWLTRERETTPNPALKGATLTADPENWQSYTTEKIFRARYGALADEYWAAISNAADEVSGYLLAYDGAPVAAAYHSMSSGVTEDSINVWQGQIPYLIPVESPGDRLAPDYQTDVLIEQKEMKRVLKNACPGVSLPDDPAGWMQVVERSTGGYVLDIAVGDQTLAGTQLRTLLGLRSANFGINWDGKSFIFTVRGYGHGVGLSQYGADYYARQGMNFEEILAHYYPGTTLAAAVFE